MPLTQPIDPHRWPKAIVQDVADHMVAIGPNGRSGNVNAATRVIQALFDAGYRIVKD